MTTVEKISVADRATAGRLIAKQLDRYSSSSAIVLGIARGGVIVAASVAEELGLPLEVIPSRKVVHPANREESIGSVTLEDAVLSGDDYGIPRDYIAHQILLLRNSLRSELIEYDDETGYSSYYGKSIIVVDDFARSGDTLLSCLKSLKKYEPVKIIAAVPCLSSKAAVLMREVADEVVYLRMDHTLKNPKDFYNRYPKVTVRDVKSVLKNSRHELEV